MVIACSVSRRPGMPILANRNRYRSRRPGVTSSTVAGTVVRSRGFVGGKLKDTRPPSANVPSALMMIGLHSG
jgi:hypothetical protein